MYLSQNEEHLISVLIVEDDPIVAVMVNEALKDCYKIKHVTSGEEAIVFCESTEPDIILLDVEMPGVSGLDVCISLKRNDNTNHIPIIFLTGHSEPYYEDRCWEAGGSDFISKPFSMKTLRHRVNAQIANKVMTDKLKKMALYDGLTGIHNRLYFNHFIDIQVKLSLRQTSPLVLLMIDVDYFKLYNDEYGHVRGDECLRSLAFAVSKVVARPTDCIARYGGEEFVVVLPNTDARGMKFVAQEIQRTVSLLNIKHEKSPHELVSVSIGGVITQSINTAEELLSKADKNLYRAKASGRNKIFLSEDVDRIA